VATALVATSPAWSAARPLRTAISDPPAFGAATRDAAYAQVVSTGASYVRLSLNWRSVAPEVKPDPFDPTDPASYDWTEFDLQIESALAAGLKPIVCIEHAPSWAGGISPNATEFGAFAEAAAKHYSGEPGMKPRVVYWQAWNEPNRDIFLKPQYENGKMVSAIRYRAMVNKFAAAVHGVNPGNRVIAGGLAPLGRPGKPAPLPFMKKLLEAPVYFDIWSHHPYTSGGPLHVSAGAGDVTLGNLGAMRTVLDQKAKKIRSNYAVEFWVTEFSWDTAPPDPDALGVSLHRRWVSEALYRMWANGVSLVTWWRIKDDPLELTPYQSGFYTVDDTVKPSLEAFRFPTVALTQKKGILVWGRTPTSTSEKVIVEIKTGTVWKKLATLQSNSKGIFTKTFKVPYRKGYVRALSGGATSVPFGLKYAKDRFVNPFGCGGELAC
jgi:hypothetical protein